MGVSYRASLQGIFRQRIIGQRQHHEIRKALQPSRVPRRVVM